MYIIIIALWAKSSNTQGWDIGWGVLFYNWHRPQHNRCISISTIAGLGKIQVFAVPWAYKYVHWEVGERARRVSHAPCSVQAS